MKPTWSPLRKAGYASVETGVTGFELMLQVYLLEFYIRGMGLNPILASAGAAIAVFWDAISDPLVGHLSDRYKGDRFGKRGSFILCGGLTMAVSCILIFSPPHFEEQIALFIWYLVSYLAVNTSMSFVSVPHIACVGDFTTTTSQRNSFFGWRLLFSNLGLLIGITLPGILATTTTEFAGRSTASYWIAGVLFLGIFVFLRSTRSIQSNFASSPKIPVHKFFSALRATFKNPYFRPLLLAFSLAAVARALNSGFALFYYKDHLKLEEKTEVTVILLVFILSIIASIPFWLKLSKRFWKKDPAFLGILGLGILSILTYPFFPSGQLTGPLAMAVLGGIAVGSILLIESLVLDTVDFDELRTHVRKDGAYFGCWKMMAKISRAIGIMLTGPLLLLTGYDNEAASQTPETSERISWIFGFGVGSVFIVSALTFRRFRMTQLVSENIKGRLKAKRN